MDSNQQGPNNTDHHHHPTALSMGAPASNALPAGVQDSMEVDLVTAPADQMVHHDMPSTTFSTGAAELPPTESIMAHPVSSLVDAISHVTDSHSGMQQTEPTGGGMSDSNMGEAESIPVEQLPVPAGQENASIAASPAVVAKTSTTQNGVTVTYKNLDTGPSAATKVLTQQAQEIIIPSYSSWFTFGNIHSIEKKALPEFFNNKNKSKTPQVYKDYRDFMVNTYRLNPSEYLTVTACRRNLAGDVCAIIRVHAVLEQWGLINYQVDPDSRPSAVGPAFTGHFRVTADTPRGLQPLFPSISVSKAQGALPAGQFTPTSLATAARVASGGDTTSVNSRSQLSKTPLSLSKNIYEQNSPLSSTLSKKRSADDASAGSEIKKPKLVCSTCGVDCTKTRYHCTKASTFDICPNCYLEGRFSSSYFSGDFLKLEDASPHHDSDAPWTDQETLLLLEGIELFDDNWLKIAEHVGTRTRDQCILQFLQLPIEDTFLERKLESLGPLQYARVPFSAADNPILSLAAFLAAVVPPKVAAAAAKSAVRELEGNTGEKGETVDNSDKTLAKPTEVPGSDINGHMPSDISDNTTAGAPDKGSESHAFEAAGATALGAAAAKARAIADHDEREMQRVTRHIIETQLKKMELKLQHFNEIEAIMEHERKELERERQSLFLDRLVLRRATLHIKDNVPKEGTTLTNFSTSLTVVVSGASSPTKTSPMTSGPAGFPGVDGIATASHPDSITTTVSSAAFKPDPNAKLVTLG
ncbi:hypothetical protein BASA61_008829 [Batrachochytrium salamandrivorans]|nr:hypothetical protein BASA61_008829 [Batrachochytrium salamandrivorans]